MKPWIRRAGFRGAFVMVLAIAALAGCSKSGPAEEVTRPRTPKEAASQVEEAFEPAPPEMKEVAEVATEALRAADYERAVVSLATLRNRENLTLQQGLSVHQSMVTLEAQLIRAIEAGDPNAKQAYETLKRLKRN